MGMIWKKPSGQTMEAQDNEETEKYLTSMGFEKIGKDRIELGEPEEETDADGQPNPPEAETCEISEADMPSQGHDPYNPADPEPEKELESISPDDVGEMPKDILDG